MRRGRGRRRRREARELLQEPAPPADDDAPSVAAPGRFPLDVTKLTSNGEGWFDIGGNMLETAWPVAGLRASATKDVCDMSAGAPDPGDPTYCERVLTYAGPDGTPVQETRRGFKRFAGDLPLVMTIGYSFETHARYADPYFRTGDEPAITGYPASFQYGKSGGRCARPAR
ncbi:MAG: hypothetical protein KIT84_01235 [Labilithrix sp.]|nr:hypothetical protein [Labilithrix sp.]MCW5809609.1 hypothetical protein [Labilithrix sp.]